MRHYEIMMIVHLNQSGAGARRSRERYRALVETKGGRSTVWKIGAAANWLNSIQKSTSPLCSDEHRKRPGNAGRASAHSFNDAVLRHLIVVASKARPRAVPDDGGREVLC